MLENKRAVIFDLDGTLIDSMWIWRDIDEVFLGERGIAVPEDLESMVSGISFTQTACYFKERFQLQESVEEMEQIWIDMAYDRYVHEVPLKPGAGEFLERLRSQGIRLGIGTSNSRSLTEAVARALHIEAYFDCMVTATEVKMGKPEPDIYLRAAGELGAAPGQCLVFEDIPAGIQAGKNAGMEVCAVEEALSEGERQRIRQLADYYIRTYYDILNQEYEVLKA